MIPNSGFQFFSEIYTISARSIKSDHKRINEFLDRQVISDIDNVYGLGNLEHCIPLYTTYPGVILGTGLPHGVSNDDEDFKIGFYFDHTYGLPIIPGSSVKGKLRSVFPNYDKDKSTLEMIKDVKSKWLITLIKNIDDVNFLEKTFQPEETIDNKVKSDISNLENEIFEGIRNGNYLSIYERDIFHDAVLVDSENKIFGVDYITPHKHKTNHELNPFSDPNPIRFVKVLPGVQFDFQFDLKDSRTEIFGANLSAIKKLKLFQKILITIGIGAKTNVGYGQLESA